MFARNYASLRKIGFAVGLSLAAAGCGSQGGAMPAMPPPQVTVVTLKVQPVTLTRELPGRTSAFLIAEVRPQVSGLIKRRLFVEGSLVKAGQPLYELDDAIYRAAYDSAQASLNKAQATLASAQLTATRSAELIKIDAISKQDNENATAALQQAQADVAAARASVQSTGVNLSYAHITAPIAGRIGKSAVTVGALVTADQSTTLTTVQQLDPMYVDVNESSSEWLHLKTEIDAGRLQASASGTPVTILLEDGTTYAQSGQLQFSDVTVDPTTGSLLLRALVPNSQNVLIPGMYVRAVISEGVREQGVLVPQEGLTRDPKGDATAFVVNAQGKVELRQVKVSRTVGASWLVESGLAAGDRVVVEGVQKVQPGMGVQAAERPATTAGSADATAAVMATS